MSDKPFTLQQIAAEISQFNQQLADSYRTLQSLTDCEVGPTPKDCIYKEDKLRLYKYRSQVADSCQTPLLICYALVNRPYMLDLDEQRSFIARLTASGIPVYLIDWGYPDTADCFLDMDDYINGYLHNCVEQVKQPQQTASDKPAGYLPGWLPEPELYRPATGQYQKPYHHGHPGGLPHAGKHAQPPDSEN